MMQPESVFQICSTIAMVGWLVLLIISPFWWAADKFTIGVIAGLLAIVYAWLICTEFNPADVRSFGNLEGVMALFGNKIMVTAGWVHYLAFDLFVGTWIKKNSVRHNISHLLVLPVLLLTFMFGPIGLLTYLVLRWIKTRNYFAESFE